MARLLAALAILLALALPAWAAEPAALKPGEMLTGRFIQERHLKGFERPVRSEGRFVLAPGTGLIWRGEVPFPIVTAISKDGIVQSVGGKETVRLSAAKIPFLARLNDMMTGAMAGDWHALEQEFSIDQKQSGGDTIFTLTPKREDPVLQPIRSIVARMGSFVEEVDIIKPEGDRDHLTFVDQRIVPAGLSPEDAAILGAARP